MSAEEFKFKHFTVRQDKCAMKIGIDSVLLGGWTDLSSDGSILDIGTGTGVLALMMAQKTSDVRIDAIDINKEACMQATSNFENSKWRDRLSCFHTSLQEYASKNKYQLIVSNPPYFGEGIKSDKSDRALARHNTYLTLNDLFAYATKLLLPQGRLVLVLPANLRNLAVRLAISNRLWLSRQTWVRPKKQEPEVRVLLDFQRQMPVEILKENIYIEEAKRHTYSKDYIRYTKDFYLFL